METLLAKAAESLATNVPNLAALGVIVWAFLRHIQRRDAEWRSEVGEALKETREVQKESNQLHGATRAVLGLAENAWRDRVTDVVHVPGNGKARS